MKQKKNDFEKKISDTFKPVISPLEKLIDIQTENSRNSKEVFNTNSINKIKKRLRFDDSIVDENLKNFNRASTSSPNNNTETDFEDNFASAGNSLINSTLRSPIDRGQFVDSYISLLNESRSKADNIYGVRKVNNIFMIGDSEIKFNENTVKVGNHTYPKSEGLMELLFKKQPDGKVVSVKDQEGYRSILEATNAHRKKYSKDGSIRTSKSRKYVNIIAPMFRGCHKLPTPKKGGSLLPKYKTAKMDSSIDLVYWDDPNELVERLRLLIAERSAGNNNHGNEIQSIIEELREGGYIY